MPYHKVVSELRGRGDVWQTNLEDTQCLIDTAKIGPDRDNRTGGCDNVLVRVPSNGALIVNYERIFD